MAPYKTKHDCLAVKQVMASAPTLACMAQVQSAMPTPKSSRVFLSYSHDSPEHQARVLALATRLVTEGIDAKLDQWVIDPEGGWPLWTERQIADADFVLLVCTDLYRKRVERPDEVEGGAGSFWEANLIRKRLYDGKGVNGRFIPIFYGAIRI